MSHRSAPPGTLRVEFYGIPRARVNTSGVELPRAATLGELLARLADRFPDFGRECLRGGGLAPQFVANLDGRQFVREAATPLDQVHCVLILSADAGG